MASSTSTKTVSARIPMADFIKFRAEAAEQKMNMNDFLLLKLYGTVEPAPQPKKEDPPVKSDNEVNLKKTVTLQKRKITTLEKKIKDYEDAMEVVNITAEDMAKTQNDLFAVGVIMTQFCQNLVDGKTNAAATAPTAIGQAKKKLNDAFIEKPKGLKEEIWERAKSL